MLKDILLMLSTFPDPTAEVALEPIVQFARRNDSFISGLALEIDIHEPSSLLPSWLIDVHTMASAAKARSRQAGDRLLERLKELCAADRVPIESRMITCWWPPLYSEAIIDLARIHDLTVVPLDFERQPKATTCRGCPVWLRSPGPVTSGNGGPDRMRQDRRGVGLWPLVFPRVVGCDAVAERGEAR